MRVNGVGILVWTCQECGLVHTSTEHLEPWSEITVRVPDGWGIISATSGYDLIVLCPACGTKHGYQLHSYEGKWVSP